MIPLHARWRHVDAFGTIVAGRFQPKAGGTVLLGRTEEVVSVMVPPALYAELEGIAEAARLSLQGCGRTVLEWLLAVRQAVIDHVGPAHHRTLARLGGGAAVWALFEGAGLTAGDITRPAVR